MLITRAELLPHLGPESAAWLDAALDTARSEADAVAPRAVPAWESRFAAAGRNCGAPATAEAARVLLLHTARPDAATVGRLYERGSAAERRAVLLALPHLPLTAAEGVPLLEDALRTNDTRLVAAAVGPYAAAHLDARIWRHAVLKCLFVGVPLAVVAGLANRARGDRELARMLTDFAAERAVAGRPVPADLTHLLAICSEEA